jgi:NAD(P)-dependent dehydrogenase (short-subunit alcohol dehydrogenase family)
LNRSLRFVIVRTGGTRHGRRTIACRPRRRRDRSGERHGARHGTRTRAGAKVAAVDVNAAGLDRLAAEPVFAGECLDAIADVSNTADCRQAVERVLERFGALDILINCAGISMSTAAGQRDAGSNSSKRIRKAGDALSRSTQSAHS